MVTAMPFALLCFIVLGVTINGVNGGCPAGFALSGGSCYALLRVKASWAESQHYCESVGASLAVIYDAEEEKFLDTFLKQHQMTSTVWIGGTDLLQEGTFVAAKTLEPLTYLHWAPGEPDDLLGQHCLSIFQNSLLWDDDRCDKLLQPLCKREEDGDNIIG